MSRRSFALASIGAAAAADLPAKRLKIDLGPEQTIAKGVPWPYLVQLRDGTTIVLAHIRWPKGGKYPIHYTAVSQDGRRTWQEWKPGPGQAPDRSPRARPSNFARVNYWCSTCTPSIWEKNASKRIIGPRAMAIARWRGLRSIASPCRKPKSAARTTVGSRSHGCMFAVPCWSWTAAICSPAPTAASNRTRRRWSISARCRKCGHIATILGSRRYLEIHFHDRV